MQISNARIGNLLKMSFLGFFVAFPIGGLIGMNVPDYILCENENGLCYSLRFNKQSVMTPQKCDSKPDVVTIPADIVKALCSTYKKIK